MTGPEHYQEAERLLGLVAGGSDYYPDRTVAQAQVHATLALAAATAQGASLPQSRPLVLPPVKQTPIDPAFPGNAWGQVLA